MIPSRPPIRLEDGLVEVGWDGDLEAEPTYADSPTTDQETSLPAEPHSDEELVEDRYAALQAWTEWTRNRERSLAVEESPGGRASTSPPTERIGTWTNPPATNCRPIQTRRPLRPPRLSGPRPLMISHLTANCSPVCVNRVRADEIGEAVNESTQINEFKIPNEH